MKISNEQAELAIANLETFQTNSGSLQGSRPTDSYYIVYSYNTKMLELRIIGNEIYMTVNNQNKYSRTTSKHQNHIKKALKTIIVKDITDMPEAWKQALTN